MLQVQTGTKPPKPASRTGMKAVRKLAVNGEEPTSSDGMTCAEIGLIVDDFIDDDMDTMDRLSVRRGDETTSRHFPLDTGDQPDRFTQKTMDECYNELIRLRNDVSCPNESF
jgi:hypothetical protein